MLSGFCTLASRARLERCRALPAERPLVLFGAIGGSAIPRKGADLLLEALQSLSSQVAGTPLEQLDLLVFGQSRPGRRAKEQRSS